MRLNRQFLEWIDDKGELIQYDVGDLLNKLVIGMAMVLIFGFGFYGGLLYAKKCLNPFM